MSDTETDPLEPSKNIENSEKIHCHSLDMDVHILLLIKPTFTVMSI